MRPPLVVVDPAIQSGTPVFAGTRVPLHNLFDYLEEGDSLDTFLGQFPSVTREQAVAVLSRARASRELAALLDHLLPRTLRKFGGGVEHHE